MPTRQSRDSEGRTVLIIDAGVAGLAARESPHAACHGAQSGGGQPE